MLIEARKVCRDFKVNTETLQILKEVDFGVEAGKMAIFMGPSGSGKTTLLNQLCLLDTPTSGEVYFLGERVDDLSEQKKDEIRGIKMGIIFQSVALLSKMSVYENIDFFLRVAKFTKERRKERTIECLRKVGLEKRMDHMPYELSGGEQQRVAIARAISHQPKIIFADEPTAELDTETSQMIMKLFRRLVEEEGLTIVMTTHDSQIASYADEIIWMKDGQVRKSD